MNRVMPRGLIVALQFLTRIPTPHLDDYSQDDPAAAAKWYPLVGLLIGAALIAAHLAGQQISPWVGPLGALALWIWITGALHLDGLADTADGLGAAHSDPDKFLAVTKDPHVGSFGVISLVLVIVAKLVLLASLKTPLAPLVLVPAWARWGPLVWRNLVPPLGDGRGKGFSNNPDWFWVLIPGAALCAASAWWAPTLLIALLIVPAFALYWNKRLGGMTGDCHGASIEITEVALLCALVAWPG